AARSRLGLDSVRRRLVDRAGDFDRRRMAVELDCDHRLAGRLLADLGRHVANHAGARVARGAAAATGIELSRQYLCPPHADASASALCSLGSTGLWTRLPKTRRMPSAWRISRFT